MRMHEAMEALMGEVRDERLVLTNGYVSREGFTARDRDGNFYMLGSMGLCPSIALGVALARPGAKVVALDGDGALLTNLGALAFAAAAGAKNFYHVVFDNGVYASTGNQRTVSERISLSALAAAAGYRCLRDAADVAEVAPRYHELLSAPGPAFLLLRVEPHEPGRKFGRVTLTPTELRDRFKRSLA